MGFTYLVGKTGQSWGRATVISAPLLYLDFLWMIWDPDSQAWHDKVFRTYVVED